MDKKDTDWSARELSICSIKIKLTRHKGAQQPWHDYAHTITAGDAAEDAFISYMSEDQIRRLNTRQQW